MHKTHGGIAMARWKIPTTGVYETDNGRVLCHAHLGLSAKHTGYDISGQQIRKVTPDWECEECHWRSRHLDQCAECSEPASDCLCNGGERDPDDLDQEDN
jgi:hypothetical protein